jgi:hypothetical protein
MGTSKGDGRQVGQLRVEFLVVAWISSSQGSQPRRLWRKDSRDRDKGVKNRRHGEKKLRQEKNALQVALIGEARLVSRINMRNAQTPAVTHNQ